LPQADEAIRRFPRVEVTLSQVNALLAPLLGFQGVRRMESVEGGLTNTILRVWPADGSCSFLVRVFAGGRAPWEKERRTLSELRAFLPVPEVLLVSDGAGILGHPSLIYRWMEGITLNAWRKQPRAAEPLSVAEPLGRLVARIAITPLELDVAAQGDWRARVSSVEELLSLARQRILSARVRKRLGNALADAFWQHFSKQAEGFAWIADKPCLVHGDLGGRNILVAPESGNGSHIVGVLDWEEAFFGWPLWDVGSLFRYPRRFGDAFRRNFESGYRAAGGRLPKDWWTAARWLDATRQLATLDEEKERPVVFAECRELFELFVQDVG
jgi:aminoglycoside phosphotransferase (APT) family kinase protein